MQYDCSISKHYWHNKEKTIGKLSAAFGACFKHGLGHGFGFQAINHAVAPVLHPASDAVLCSGMVHNMEPAVYIDGKGGIRLNDNVVVRSDGNEVLSSQLPRELDWL